MAIERRAPEPLVRLGVLRSASLVRANAGAVMMTGSFFGFQFLVTLYLQELRGWSSLETGLAMLGLGVDAILSPLLTPLLVRRFGNTRVIFAGFLISLAGFGLFLRVGPDTVYALLLASTLLIGLYFALAYGPITIVATEDVDESEQGLASGLLNTAFQFGAAFGISAVTAVHVAA
ncbi:MFS transporter, partial [Actinomadura adrarensis]